MTIEHFNETKNGHFKAIANEIEAGRMTYTWGGTDKFIIDHTEVNPDFAGQSVGKKNGIGSRTICPRQQS